MPSRCHLGADRRSVAALEFALIAPVMLVLFLGTIELTNVIRAQQKLNIAAGQLVELVAGESSVTEGSGFGPKGTLGDMCTGAAMNMLPFNPQNVAADIASNTVVAGPQNQANPPNKLAVDWVDARSCPQPYTVDSTYGTAALEAEEQSPLSLFTQNGSPAKPLVLGFSAIAVVMSYTYSNVVPFVLGPSITLTATAVARPRVDGSIGCTIGITTNVCPTPAS